jgi:hypothetical protein
MACETNARHALASAAPNGIAPAAARTAHGRGKLQADLSRHRKKLVVGAGIAAAAGGTYLGLRAAAPNLASRTSALELASLKPVLKRAMQVDGFETQDRLLYCHDPVRPVGSSRTDFWQRGGPGVEKGHGAAA